MGYYLFIDGTAPLSPVAREEWRACFHPCLRTEATDTNTNPRSVLIYASHQGQAESRQTPVDAAVFSTVVGRARRRIVVKEREASDRHWIKRGMGRRDAYPAGAAATGFGSRFPSTDGGAVASNRVVV